MQKRSKLLLATLTAGLALAACVAIASANRLAQTEANMRITYSPLSFVPSGGSPFRCPVTLEGSLHARTFAKVAGSLIGYINRAVMGACESGTFRFNTETLPWHLQYGGFSGTLPAISSIEEDVAGLSYELQGAIFGLRVNCRYTPALERFGNSRESRGIVTSQTPGSEWTASETEGCPTLSLSGTGSVKTPGGGSIVISLVA